MILIVTIVHFLTLLTGLYCLRTGGPVILYLILAQLLLAFINENLLVLHSMAWWHIPRNVCYNIYSLIDMGTWFTIFFLSRHGTARVLVVAVAAVNFSCTFYELYSSSPHQFHSRSYCLYSGTLLALSTGYLVQITRKDHHPTGDYLLFTNAAVLCFHSVFILNLLTLMDPAYWNQASAAAYFDLLQSAANILFYALLCTAFILYYYKSSPPRERRSSC